MRAFIAQSQPGTPEAQGADREGAFNRLALELFGLQFQLNPPYRRFCVARKLTPETVEHWTRIPAVPTSAFKEQEFSCLAPEQRTTVFHSSGTTQQRPSRHFHHQQSLQLYESSLWAWFAGRVLSKSAAQYSVVSLTPPPAAAPHSSLVHMFATIHRHLGGLGPGFVGITAADGTWELQRERTVSILESGVQTPEPLLVLGTAFSFVHLLDELAERDLCFHLPAGSLVLETGGYKGRSRTLPKTELHRLMGQRLGIAPDQIVREYGMSELSSQAYAWAGKHAGRGAFESGAIQADPFLFPPWARAQILSPETGCEVGEGEAGLVRILDLANAFSVSAVQTEDLATRRGAGFELIGRAALAESRGCSLMAK